MSILDWFKFTPPNYKKFGLFVSRYLTHDDQIRILYLDIGLSECLDGLEVELDTFKKNIKAVFITILTSRIPKNFNDKTSDEFIDEAIKSVKKFNGEIGDLIANSYGNASDTGGLEGLINTLNEKVYNNKLDKNVKLRLLQEFKTIEDQFDMALSAFK